MQPFKSHKGIVAPLDTANVDTDQIIAKQFLKSIKRTGFGEHLFHDWRFKSDGSANADFSLNQERYKKASILVARNNFGCGSSREHAVWAVLQYGFKVVIAPSKGEGNDHIPGFADIFRNNSVKNGLLTVELKENEVNEIFEATQKHNNLEISVDLDKQTVTVHAPTEKSYSFEIDAGSKDRLLNGLDDIGITLKEASTLDKFESRHNPQLAI